MDTSNSKNIVSPVSVILGDQQFSQTLLSLDDWVLILNRVLDEMKPRLKYLHGFVHLKDHLNQKLERPEISFVTNINDEHVVDISAPSVSGKTRVLRVCFLPFSSKKMEIHVPQGDHDGHDYWGELLLTQEGDLLNLNGYYVQAKHYSQGTRRKYLAEKVKIDQVILAELPLTQEHSVLVTLGGHVLNHLFALLELTVKIRQEHVDEMKESLDEIQSMRNHIEFCSGSMLRGNMIM
jgi:hypothetical protein